MKFEGKTNDVGVWNKSFVMKMRSCILRDYGTHTFEDDDTSNIVFVDLAACAL